MKATTSMAPFSNPHAVTSRLKNIPIARGWNTFLVKKAKLNDFQAVQIPFTHLFIRCFNYQLNLLWPLLQNMHEINVLFAEEKDQTHQLIQFTPQSKVDWILKSIIILKVMDLLIICLILQFPNDNSRMAPGK